MVQSIFVDEMKYLLLSILFLLPIVGAVDISKSEGISGVIIQSPISPINYSSINVNNSQFLRNLIPQEVANLYVETDPKFIAENASLWAEARNKFNATYDKFAYNQTIPAITYCDAQIGINESRFLSTFNATYDATSQDVTDNRSAWFSTFNASYDAKVSAVNDGITLNTLNLTNLNGLTNKTSSDWTNITGRPTACSAGNFATALPTTSGGALTCSVPPTFNSTYDVKAGTGNCAAGSVVQNTTTSGVQCIASATGTVTSITAGAGLNATTITTSGTINVNFTTTQQRVTGTCAAGNYVTAIAGDGTVTCGVDAGTARLFSNTNADLMTTNATIFNQSILSLTVSANANYTFVCDLWVTSVGATTGIQTNVTVPASPTYLNVNTNEDTAIATASFSCSGTARECATIATTSNGATLSIRHIYGRLINGANAGSIQVALRSETQGNLVTVKRGSYCHAVNEN